MMEELQFANSDSLIPLYIGITGHRDIFEKDQTRLKSMIRDFIESKKKKCPHTPVVVLTPLAEGADRLAATAAIESGTDFIAALPMPRDMYIRSFTSEESISEFDKLLEKASKIIVLPGPKGIPDTLIYEDPEYRHELYYQIGMFTVRYCHTLIALWDGVDNKKKSGTAGVVNSKKSGGPGRLGKTFEKLQHLQTGPIYHIVTPHRDNPSPDNPFAVRTYYSIHFGNDKAAAEEHDRELLVRLDSLNEDIANASISLKNKAGERTEKLLNSNEHLKHDQALLIIAKRRGIISELTMGYQKRRILALRILLILVVVAFISLQIYAEFYGKPVYLILYPLIMGAGGVWYYLAKRNRVEQKHEDYRALAEAFRVQFYLKACGSNDNVSDQYLKRHRGELEWVLYTLRSSEIDIWPTGSSGSTIWENKPVEAFVFLRDSWVNEQLLFFNKSAERQNRLHRKWEMIANWFFAGAILSACLLFMVSINSKILSETNTHIHVLLHSVFLSCTHVFLITAAILHGYSDKMVFGENAKNYQQMAHLYDIANIKLSEAIIDNDLEKAEGIIWELAHEALVENGDWLLLHRSRPMEMPKG